MASNPACRTVRGPAGGMIPPAGLAGLLQFGGLHRLRAEHGADLAALRLRLIGLLDRALDPGTDCIQLAAEAIERGPVLEFGDQEDIRVARRACLNDENPVAENEPGF